MFRQNILIIFFHWYHWLTIIEIGKSPNGNIFVYNTLKPDASNCKYGIETFDIPIKLVVTYNIVR